MYNKEENKEEDAPLKNEIFYDYKINMEPWAYRGTLRTFRSGASTYIYFNEHRRSSLS